MMRLHMGSTQNAVERHLLKLDRERPQFVYHFCAACRAISPLYQVSNLSQVDKAHMDRHAFFSGLIQQGLNLIRYRFIL